MYLPRTAFPSTTTTSSSTSQSSPQQCGFPGNPDIYGLGIRLGVYCQLLAVWLSHYFVPPPPSKSTSSSASPSTTFTRDAVTVFSIALLIVSCKFAAQPQDVFAVEAFLLLHMLAWSSFMLVRARSAHGRMVLGGGGTVVRSVFCGVMDAAIAALLVWFWWRGVGEMKVTPGGKGCETWMLLYIVKTGMLGWARKVSMVIVLLLVPSVWYWVGMDNLGAWMYWRVGKESDRFEDAVRWWVGVEKRREVEEVETAQRREEEAKEIKRADEEEERLDEEQESIRLEQQSLHKARPESESASIRSATHDGCSRYSCSRCSPTESHFGVDREATLVVKPKARPNFTATASLSPSKAPVSSPWVDPAHPLPITPAMQLSEAVTHSTTLAQLHIASDYITHCLIASPYVSSDISTNQPLNLWTTLFSSRSNGKTRPAYAGPGWLTCQLRICKALVTLRIPRQALVLYAYLDRSGRLNPRDGAFQMCAAITYTPPSPPSLAALPAETPAPTSSITPLPAPPIIALATLLLPSPTSTTPTVKPRTIRLQNAFLDLLVHALMILQIELALAWNHVEGIGGLWGSVGQLVPFVIGVGGLGMVGGRAVTEWLARRRGEGKGIGGGRDGGKRGEEEKDGEDDKVREAYERWKQEYEGNGRR